MEKKVYVIKGSEDGVIGIMSNKTKALERAVWYMKLDPDRQEKNFRIKDRVCNQGNFNKELDAHCYVQIENADDRVTVEVEIFYLNQ